MQLHGQKLGLSKLPVWNEIQHVSWKLLYRVIKDISKSFTENEKVEQLNSLEPYLIKYSFNSVKY